MQVLGARFDRADAARAALAELRDRFGLGPGAVAVRPLGSTDYRSPAERHLLAGRFDYTDRGILDRTHLRFFTKRTAVALLEDSGFRVERVQAAVPVPLGTHPFLSRLAYLVGNLWPSLLGYTFVITARAGDAEGR